MPRPCRARARSRATSSRTAGATSSPKLCSSARVVAREDERADAVLEREPGEALGELARVGVELADVEQAPDLARVAADRLGRLVDRGVAAAEVAGLHVPERGQPAVALAPGEREHAGLVRADPDRDVVGGARSALRAVHPVVLAVGEGAAALARVPELADDVDRLLERGHRLAGGEASAAHGLDRVPEAAGAEARGRSGRPRGGRGSPRTRATTAGGRSGTLSTLGAIRMLSVRAATKVMSVHVSRNAGWYGWSWKVTRSRPDASATCESATGVSGFAAAGVMKAPNSSRCP